ncbi:1195_t:CDS:1, partial [Paraglomus brasilianum]
PRIHKTHMAICLDCWQLIQVNDVKPKKVYASALYRYVEKIEPADLMKYHWDNECDKPKTDFGKARIIQRAWRRFQEKEPSNARLA